MGSGTIGRFIAVTSMLAGLAVVGTDSANAAWFAPVESPASTDVREVPLAFDETDTVLILHNPTLLLHLEPQLAASGLHVVGLQHNNGGRAGGLVGRHLTFPQALRLYRDALVAWSLGEPEITAVRVAGDISARGLGQLDDLVATRSVVSSEAPFGSQMSETGEKSETTTLPAFTGGEWAPEHGSINAYDSGQCSPGFLSCTPIRAVTQTLTFDRDHPGTAFNFDWAYEHDVKLINTNNWTVDRSMCPQQNDEFWTNRDAGLAYSTDIPDSYLDTNASDNCQLEDLTVGTYQPRKFERKTYTINIAVMAGNANWSQLEVEAQARHKDCDWSPWCVGLRGYSANSLLVGRDVAVVPGCRFWTRGQSSSQC